MMALVKSLVEPYRTEEFNLTFDLSYRERSPHLSSTKINVDKRSPPTIDSKTFSITNYSPILLLLIISSFHGLYGRYDSLLTCRTESPFTNTSGRCQLYLSYLAILTVVIFLTCRSKVRDDIKYGSPVRHSWISCWLSRPKIWSNSPGTIITIITLILYFCNIIPTTVALPYGMRNGMSRKNLAVVRPFVLKQYEPNLPETDIQASGPVNCPQQMSSPYIYYPSYDTLKRFNHNYVVDRYNINSLTDYNPSSTEPAASFSVRSTAQTTQPIPVPNGPPPPSHLVENTNPNIIYKQTKDRFMTKTCKEKLDLLSLLVSLEWSGVKIKVLKGWTPAKDERSRRSLHTCGRALDITVSDYDHSKNGLLAGLAVKANFQWVHYRQRSFIHVSVESDNEEPIYTNKV